MEKEILKKETKKLNKFQIYTLYLFIFSILGWCMETLYAFILSGHFVNRGFLYGPLCPIYGFGALILIIFLEKYKNNKFKLFTYAAIICSIFEYLVSYILEVLFHSYWWDYTNDFLNLNGRISIFYTLAWGVIAIIFIGYIYPFFKKKLDTILSKIPYKVKNAIINLTYIIFIIDIVLSCIKYLNT